jgi:hypothetical protein
MPRDDILERLPEHVDEQVKSITAVGKEGSQEREQSPATLFVKSNESHLILPLETASPLETTSPLEITSPLDKTRFPSSASTNGQSRDVIQAADRTNGCRANCGCACHKSQRSVTSSDVSGILGQLFVEHTGSPTLRNKCDMPTCSNARASSLYAQHWVSFGGSCSQAVRFYTAYQTRSRPPLQLRILRRVPDSAPAVSFAMSGNIQGLQDLFCRGAASPQDVSDTRGYSLLRVNSTPPKG